jgi:delta1-piperideine-2-carboxylate reductase
MTSVGNDASTSFVTYALDDIESLCSRILTRHGLSQDQARALSKVLTAGERDECRSHGVYRIPGCVKTVQSPKFRPNALPELSPLKGPVLRVDAKFGFSCLALEMATPDLVVRANEFGMAALVMNNCFHFSALWYEVEELAKHGLVSVAMNPSLRAVAPAGGTKALFGTNPFAFGWPRPEGNPYVFDFATSEVARGEIELHRQNGKDIPLGWAIDKDGDATTDPAAGLAGAMLTFGGHKGSALSTMIELLAGPLINDMMSFESSDFDAGAGAAPCHGELIVAFSPERLLGMDKAAALERAEDLFRQITEQGARLPSQRRFEARQRSQSDGVKITRIQHNLLQGLLQDAA